jgi:hypothetical protein
MVRKRLVASVAAAPLLIFAGSAWAETTITNERTAPVTTATINNGAADDLTITNAGKITLTTGGPAVTLNSNNDVKNGGAISTKAVDHAVGILVQGGFTGDVTNTGTIIHDDDYTAEDSDKDGDDDGPLAHGTDRYGIRVVGPGVMDGSLTNSGSISISGEDSYGISVETGMTGQILNYGTVTVIGDNGVGVKIAGDVAGGATAATKDKGVYLGGTISVQGENSIGADVSGDIDGALVVQGAITARGYRYAVRPATKEIRAQLEADDKLQGGPALRVTGNVAGGIYLDVAYVNDPTKDDDGDGIKNNTDDDDDGDTIKDVDDTDDDNDGIPDVNEGSATLSVLGSAPALLIGSDTQNTTIGDNGLDGANEDYGLIIKGAISSDGIFDNVSSSAVVIGGAGGFDTDLSGGIRVDGTITSRSYNANATSIRLRDGAIADELLMNGVVVAVGETTSAPLNPTPGQTGETAIEVVGIQVDAGAEVHTIRVGGVVSAAGVGENATAIAIRDSAGSVSLVENTGSILSTIQLTDDADDTDDADTDASNEAHNGKQIALDLRANTTGVTVRQMGVNDGDDGADGVADADADADGVDDDQEPAIAGDVLFGSGADTLDLQNGALRGDMSFGAGADTFLISGGATAIGALSDSDGQLAINIGKGALTTTNTGVINGTSLTMGADAALTITADTTTNTNTTLVVGSANIASGAQIGLVLTGLTDGPERYVVVQAGSLTVGNLDQSLLENSPYIYVAQATADVAAGEVYLDVRRRTASEMGLTENQGKALDAVYAALSNDEDVADAFLGATDRKHFINLYNQLLPDQGEGLFSALDTSSQAISRLTATRPDLTQRYGPDSFWVQELNVAVMRDAGATLGSETKAFGFIAGYESMGDDGGALGATLAYLSAEEKDDVAQIGEQTNISLLEAGVYWRRATGPWLFSMRGSAGYGFFEGERRFIDPATATIKSSNASWGGYTLAANATGAYEARFGRFYLRPTVSLDYFYLSEGEREEDGDSDSLNLIVDERSSSRLSAAAELAFGATFGRDSWWRPEIRLGYRQVLAGEIGDTTARFVGGDGFTLTPMEAGDGAMVVGLSLKAGTPMSYVAIEGELESTDGEDRYNLRLAGRMMF